MFQEFLKKHTHLIVVNHLDLCQGLITRRRKTSKGLEEAVLDFFVICNRISRFIVKMTVDEEKQFVLSRYGKEKGKYIKKDSDHNTMILDMDISYFLKKPDRIELFNFKDTEGQHNFKKLTTETSEFSKCFEDDAPLLDQIDNWQKVLKSSCSKAFKKIRIKNHKMKPMNKEISDLIDKRNQLVNGSFEDPNCKAGIDGINNKIAGLEAEENKNKLVENFEFFSDNPEKINMSQMWKLMKKLWPKTGNNLPTAKKNHKGKLYLEQRR